MLINMKRKVDWEEEEQSERGDYSDEESDDRGGTRIKDVLDNLSQAFPESVLQNCCTVWPLPKTFCFGHHVSNYSDIGT